MSIIITGMTFENPGQPDDKKFTVYDLEIVEKEKGFQNTFVIRKSYNMGGKGAPITEDLILNTVSAMVDRSKKLNGLQVLEDNQGLQTHQVTIYAEREDGDFYKCSFREYHPTTGAAPVIDFTREGGGKIEVTKEYVKEKIAEIENWKHRQPEIKLEEATFEPPPREVEIVSNPNIKKQEPERER